MARFTSLPLLLLLLPLITRGFPQERTSKAISDSAFNEIISNYYNTSPFYSMIDPQELLREFANKKIVRKKKLRPRKRPLIESNDLRKKARMHIRHKEESTTTTTPSSPIKTLRMRNKPVYDHTASKANEFAERSYDYEIDVFDRNALGDDNYEDYIKSEEAKEKDIYAELETFFPGTTNSERDPASVEYEERHKNQETRMKRPIFTPSYGHPYAQPLSQPNPMDSGIFEVDYISEPQPNGKHFDIPKIHKEKKKTTQFAPTIPTTTSSTTTTTRTTTTTTQSTTSSTITPKPAIPTKLSRGQPAAYVRTLARRFPRVNDYNYDTQLPPRRPEKEDLSQIKLEHREVASGPSYRKHPGYRDLPQKRRSGPPRRRPYKTKAYPSRKEKIPQPHYFESKEQFVPSFAPPKSFRPAPYTSAFSHPEYKALEQRFPKPKNNPATRDRYTQPYEPPTSHYTPTKPLVPILTPTPYQPKPVEFRSKDIQLEGNLGIDTQFKKFRDNTEFSGYLDNSESKGSPYDFARGFPLLPPPPAMLATTQNFFGFSDVPKLGSKVNYNPPELIFNQMYEGAKSRGDEKSYAPELNYEPKPSRTNEESSFGRIFN